MKFAPTQRVRIYCSGDGDFAPGYESWPPTGNALEITHLLPEWTEGFIGRADLQYSGLQQDVIGEYVYLVAFDNGKFLYVQERHLEAL